MLYLIVFCLFVFFVAWYIIKRRWKLHKEIMYIR